MSGGVMSWDFALGGFGLGRLASIIIRLKEDGTQCNRANIKETIASVKLTQTRHSHYKTAFPRGTDFTGFLQ